MTPEQAFRTPAELAVAVQQWITYGDAEEAGRYAIRAYRLAQAQNYRTFPWPPVIRWGRDDSSVGAALDALAGVTR